MKVFTIVFITLGLISSTHSQAQAQSADPSSQKNYLMAAMGDSISAGFLAATYLGWFNSATDKYKDDIDAFVANLEQNYGRNPETLNISGDVAHILESRATYSWATGKLIPSQYILLKQKILQAEPSAKVFPYNVAISGGITSDLITEATSLVTKMKSGKYDALKYVTLLIGNNDVCHSLPESTMRTNIHEAFRLISLIKQSEPIRILMSGIPRIPDVAAPAIRTQKTIFGLSCQEFRKMTKSCPDMSTWGSQQEYDAQIQKVQGTNELLSQAADDANKSFSNLDVVFSDRLFNLDVAAINLAVDCFHPNAATQALISQELWTDQPWYQ